MTEGGRGGREGGCRERGTEGGKGGREGGEGGHGGRKAGRDGGDDTSKVQLNTGQWLQSSATPKNS